MLRKHADAHDNNEKEEEFFHGFHYYLVPQASGYKSHSINWLFL